MIGPDPDRHENYRCPIIGGYNPLNRRTRSLVDLYPHRSMQRCDNVVVAHRVIVPLACQSELLIGTQLKATLVGRRKVVKFSVGDTHSCRTSRFADRVSFLASFFVNLSSLFLCTLLIPYQSSPFPIFLLFYIPS